LIRRANEVLKWSCEVTERTKEIKVLAEQTRARWRNGQARQKAIADAVRLTMNTLIKE